MGSTHRREMLEGKALKMTWTYNIYSIQALGQVPLLLTYVLGTFIGPLILVLVTRDVDFLISYAKVFFIDRTINKHSNFYGCDSSNALMIYSSYSKSVTTFWSNNMTNT